MTTAMRLRTILAAMTLPLLLGAAQDGKPGAAPASGVNTTPAASGMTATRQEQPQSVAAQPAPTAAPAPAPTPAPVASAPPAPAPTPAPVASNARDPRNPTCPESLNWSTNRTMELTLEERNGLTVLRGEGVIDRGLPDRLRAMFAENPTIAEFWLRSPGGNAQAGNEAGRVVRSQPGMVTRIPAGWACFSACNFVFMGGMIRVVEPEAQFIVHMFTLTGNRNAIDMEVAQGLDSTIELIGGIEQESALMATEDNDFLIRMGVSRELLTDVMYRQSAVGDGPTRRCLTREEAYRYNVANAG